MAESNPCASRPAAFAPDNLHLSEAASDRRESVQEAEARGPAPVNVRVRAIATADSDGKNSALDLHANAPEDTCRYKYKIEKSDIAKLVEGANSIFSDVRLVFDPDRDFEFRKNTLLNRDSLTPPETVPEAQLVYYVDPAGNIRALRLGTRGGDKWTPQDVSQTTSAPAAVGRPSTYTTAASAVRHIVYRDQHGSIHELWTSGGSWRHNPISARASAPIKAVSDPFGYATWDSGAGQLNKQHVVYRGTDDNIHQLYTTDKWNYRALSPLVGAPKAAGRPFCYTTLDSAGNMVVQHVVYRGGDGKIYELYTVGDQWRISRLTELSGAQLASGDPVAYTTALTDVQHVVYRGVDSHIHELFALTEWRHKDLSAATGAPSAGAGPVAFAGNDTDTGAVDEQHVIYVDRGGVLRELHTRGGAWAVKDLTAETGARDPSGELTAYTTGSRDAAFVVYRTWQGGLNQIATYVPSGRWWSTAFGEAVGASAKAAFGPLGCYLTNDQLCGLARNRLGRSYRGSLVVYFRYGGGGWSNAIDEFVVMPSLWNPRDLTFLAHEVGHYFHLPHSYWGGSYNEAQTAIREYVEALAKNDNNGQLPDLIPARHLDRGLEAIDADRFYVTDTPAEIALVDKDKCTPYDHPASITVWFKNQKKEYTFEDSFQNVMNYQPKRGQPAVLSGGQRLRMRIALRLRNRKHLLQ